MLQVSAQIISIFILKFFFFLNEIFSSHVTPRVSRNPLCDCKMDHLPFWHYPPQAAGVGYGQGSSDIIEWMGSLDPSKWQRTYGWMDPDFLMTDFLENYSLPSGFQVLF